MNRDPLRRTPQPFGNIHSHLQTCLCILCPYDTMLDLPFLQGEPV